MESTGASEAEESRDEEQKFEQHPAPGDGAEPAPDGSDCRVAAEDYVEENKLQARADVEEHQADQQSEDADENDEGKESGHDRGRFTRSGSFYRRRGKKREGIC